MPSRSTVRRPAAPPPVDPQGPGAQHDHRADPPGQALVGRRLHRLWEIHGADATPSAPPEGTVDTDEGAPDGRPFEELRRGPAPGCARRGSAAAGVVAAG